MTKTSSKLVAFGYGYCAARLTQTLEGAGPAVYGATRDPAKAPHIEADGATAFRFGDPIELDGADLLISAPPGEDGCPVFAAYGEAAAAARSVIYLSTTGVYGDLGGGWAFEWTPAAPGSDRGEARVRAEAQWASSPAPVRMVRLPGIYGPGRSPFDRLREGTAKRVVKPGQVFSRVHVDDIASGLAALLARPCATGVFNLCDDLPAPPQDVTAFAASLLGLDPPPETPFEEAGLSPMARSFYAECKRVSNARAKAALGWRPAYPTYRDGLAAVLAEEGA